VRPSKGAIGYSRDQGPPPNRPPTDQTDEEIVKATGPVKRNLQYD
jgi:hypothetical protein